MTTVLSNARVILEDEVVDGTVVLEGGLIREVAAGPSRAAGAVDCDGDYVAPGLIEMHTDNLEKHFVPRPQVIWPNGLAAALAHDAQMAAAGVTTVYDALCAGYGIDGSIVRREIFDAMIAAVTAGVEGGIFRIDHRLHLRCELTGPDLVSEIEPHADHKLLKLVSLMDHTPGQRQWRDVRHLKTYSMGTSGKSEAEFEAHVRQRIEAGTPNVERNWPVVVDMFAGRGIPLATHDDTIPEHIDAAVRSGAVISEFPTTIEAAAAAKRAGLATVAGAPNVVRGGSHSGGVSVADLARRGTLDGLSSDYVPASLLQAVRVLSTSVGLTLPAAIGMVTWRIADVLGLRDRGHLRAGLRADVVRFRFHGETPVVRGLWCNGRPAM